jgi:YesN/AraC family two-component response regulator
MKRRNGSMKSILFVDDDIHILEGIRRMLDSQRDQWDMHFALGGKDALLICTRFNFDAVISDMRMPGMDGATLLTHIQTILPNAARLILSGYSDVSHRRRASRVAHQILAKPCDADELRISIEQACKSAAYQNFTDL